MKIRWLSRHQLSPAQIAALRELHGKRGVELEQVVHDTQDFPNDPKGLEEYLRAHDGDFVYVVAPAVQYLQAALAGLSFGLMVNHPGKREDGTFGLASVYWVNRPEMGEVELVWTNPNPLNDCGESLVPAHRFQAVPE